MLSRLYILAAAVLFSSGGAAIKGVTLGPWPIACLRSAIAATALLILLPSARRGYSWRTWLVGLAYAATMILFVLGTKLTTAASTIFLQSTAPIWVLLLGPFLLGEKITRRDVGFMLPVVVGFALLFIGVPAAVTTAPDPFLGNILAACAGVTWALTVMGLRWLGRTSTAGDAAAPARPSTAGAAVVAGNVIAAAIALPWAWEPTVAGPPVGDLLLLSWLGVVQIGLAYACLTRGLQDVPALEASLLLLLEPVLNPVFAWLAHGGAPGPLVLAGGALVILATAAKSVWGKRAGPHRVAFAQPIPAPPGEAVDSGQTVARQ